MSQKARSQGLGVFRELATFRNQTWSSHERLLDALCSRFTLSDWAKNLIRSEDFWLAPERAGKVEHRLVAPTLEEIGLGGKVSLDQIRDQGVRVHHLREIAAQFGLEHCLYDRSPIKQENLLLVMFPIRYNGNSPGSFILRGRLLDVLALGEKVPSARFPEPVRALFGQRAGA